MQNYQGRVGTSAQKKKVKAVPFLLLQRTCCLVTFPTTSFLPNPPPLFIVSLVSQGRREEMGHLVKTGRVPVDVRRQPLERRLLGIEPWADGAPHYISQASMWQIGLTGGAANHKPYLW